MADESGRVKGEEGSAPRAGNSAARVSVVLPAYNASNTVARSIGSALAQNFDDRVEVIATDDGSTDSTRDILAALGQGVRVIGQTNRGAAAARNAAAALARGEYLALLDADDVWLPNKLRSTIGALQENPRAVLAYSDILCVNGRGEPVPAPSPPNPAGTLEQMLCGSLGPIYSSTVVMRRSAFVETGGFCEEFRGAGFEDTLMWLRMRELGEFVCVPEALVLYRCPDFEQLSEKYGQNLSIYIRLVRQRYGRAAARVVARHTHSQFAASLLTKAARHLGEGRNLAAAWTMLRALRHEPLRVLGSLDLQRRLKVRDPGA